MACPGGRLTLWSPTQNIPKRLNRARGFDVLIDRTEIYAFEDWWKRIEALIARADTIVFVLSPDAVTSNVALKEVVHAAALKKRFAPIVWIVTGSEDKAARIWDAATGEQLAVLSGHELGVASAAFSPDGTLIVTGSGQTATIWDVAAGQQLKVLRGHLYAVVSASFGPDGQTVVTASSDGTSRVWDVASGTEIATLRGHRSDVRSAASTAPASLRPATTTLHEYGTRGPPTRSRCSPVTRMA
jgi:WD40 repeat protein